MRIKCLIGTRKGEIRDYPPEIAKKMLADGRAAPVRDEEDMEMAIVGGEDDEDEEQTVRRRGRPRGSKNRRREN
jgi:hypothetical protein